MDKTRIIVVEDNIVYCEYVCNLLAREGYSTVKAYHLSTAKKHLQQATDDDIVVSDLRLNDGNGIDLLRWMRKEGKMQPFIIMTDYAEVHTAVESMKLGSIDYIPKKLIEDKLVPLIRSIQKERQSRHSRMPVFAREGSAFQKIMHRIKLVAATNEDLEAAVSEKRFRQDLLYRLQDFVITVPPLRDCQEDIMPLAEFFREIANKELECNVSGFSSEARKALLTHAWPGNVRELRQKIMGAVLQAQEGVVTKEHLELAVTKPTSPVSFALRNDAEDKERIMRALKQTNGNRSAAAELLGISRATLYSKLEEYGLKYKFKQS